MDDEVHYMKKTSLRQECTLLEGTMEHNLSMKMTRNSKKKHVYGLNLKNYLTNKFMKVHTCTLYYML